MKQAPVYSWILDSGGAGRGAWQGGVLYEFMRWALSNDCYPRVCMGASAGGYAAADVATGTERTVMKGWTIWGNDRLLPQRPLPRTHHSFWGMGKFRLHLHTSIRRVMEEKEVLAVFDSRSSRVLAIFTTRVRRRDGKPMSRPDHVRFCLRSMTRKLPKGLKYLPVHYVEDPVVFATGLDEDQYSEFVRPLTADNFHQVIEASCLVPLAMGDPLQAHELAPGFRSSRASIYQGDRCAVFMDGGFAVKMPMSLLEEDPRFTVMRVHARADKTLVFCCDPKGSLWESSSRLRRLNDHSSVVEALAGNRMLVIHPDHEVEAGFLCCDNATVMRTFRRGQEQAFRLLRSDAVRRFFDVP